jgi:beta-xylosidase
VCTPYDGLFLWTTKDPAGPWSEMVTVRAVAGWEDPCPFWDEDGSAYLVHSRKGAGPLILHKMSVDGTYLLDDGVEIYRGHVRRRRSSRNGSGTTIRCGVAGC